MIGIVICTFIVCVAVVICVLGWKYLDEQDDLSYPRFNEIKKRLDRVEKTINADQPYGGIFNEFGFDAKDNENGGRSSSEAWMGYGTGSRCNGCRCER